MAGRTAKYYATHPEARAKRLKQQAAYDKREGQSEHRAECNRGRRELGLKKGDKRDASHTKDGRMVKEDRSKNRARNGANGKSTKK